MSASPIHVHVQDNTPLHVHVKKPKKTELFSDNTQKIRARGNARHSVRPGPRSKSKTVNDPWVPAPGKTSIRGDKVDKQFKWDSGRSQLEINQPRVDLNIHGMNGEPLRASDLSTEEDNRLRSHLNDYERKIESLMAEVGTLKNEAVNFKKTISNRSCEKHKVLENKRLISSSESEKLMKGGLENDEEKGKHENKSTNYHANCFAEVSEYNPTDRRVLRALMRLTKSEEKEQTKKKILSEQKQNIDPLKNINCRIIDNNKDDATLFLDSSYLTDFENQCHEKNPNAESAPVQAKVSFKEPLVEHETDRPQFKINDSYNETSCNYLSDTMTNQEWRRSCDLTDSKMELKKVEEDLEDKEEQLVASKAVLKDKQKELNYIAKEYEETEKENFRLRKSMERYQDNMATSLKEMDEITTSEDALLHQLVEVEVSGADAGKQVAALRDIVKRLKYEKRLSHSDVGLLNKQRELLLQKLDDFEASNRTCRRLLQTEHKTISDIRRLEDQRDMLMKKMADTDSDILRFRSELIQRKNDAEQLAAQVDEEKNHARTLNELNKSVETTRAHLQRELRTKEMENNRLHVQLKNMERDTDAVRREAEELTAAAKSERETIAREKEGLKRATRAQRNRAEKAEDALKEAETRLDDRERKLEEARSQADAWRERYQRASDEKVRMEDHVQSLATRVAENDSLTRTNDLLTRNKEDDLKLQIERLTSDHAVCRADAERYKSDAGLAEERTRQAQQDAAKLRADVRQHETVEADLRAQLRKAKSEAEEALLTAERVERSSRRMREDGTNEIERVREQMLDRMKDLQPLPELLKETEMQLQDAQDKLHVYEQRSAEQTRLIAELTNKDDDHADETTTLKQRIGAITDENRALEARLQILHVKLDDRDVRVKESVLDTVNKDEKIQQLQLKMEEVTHERDSYKRQLDAAVSDSRKAVGSEIEKAAAREHAGQARIVDLETQITRLKTDIVSLKRSKEDNERRSQSKLQDTRDRLEQAESTNRSMRNYVNFLKTSYNNVFGGDASLTSTPIRSGPPGGSQSPY